MKGMIEWMARNGVAANLLMTFMLVTGVVSLVTITVKLFPEVDPEQVRIQVPYPGASPEEIEESIVRRIEENIESVEEIREINATAAEGMGSVTVELVRGADTQRRLDEIKSEIDRIVTFPEDAEEPQVSQLSTQQRVLQIVLSGNAGERDLKELANRVKDELTFMPEISIVNIAGTRAYEISIEASIDKLRSYGLTLNDLSAAVRRESLELPGGEIETDSEELVLRTLGRNYTREDFEEIVVRTSVNGGRVLLGDVATVRDGFTDTDLITLYNGQPAVMVNVMRVGEEQLLDIARVARRYVEDELRPSLPAGVNATIERDDAEVVKDRLTILGQNGVMGLFLVILALTLFLELRVAVWTSLGIMIAFIGVFTIMSYLGVSINVISTMGFLLAIGIVVDDAIVVGENIFARHEAGMPPLQAAISGAQRIAVPVIFAVGTTIAAFSSLLTLPGTLGALLGDIPVIVIGVLFLSVVEALLVLPYHLSVVTEKSNRRPHRVTRFFNAIHQRISRGFKTFIEGPLDRALRFVTSHPWVTVSGGICVLFLTAGILAGGLVRFNFFPQIQGEYVIANVELPTGATVERTEAVVRDIEDAAIAVGEEMEPRLDGGEPLVRSINLLIGAQDSGQPDPLQTNSGASTPNVATVIVELTPPEERDFPSSDFEEAWRERVGTVPQARKLTFSSEQMSFGDPIRVELTTSDRAAQEAVVSEVESALRQIAGVFDVRNDSDTGKREITFGLKPKARAYGLSLESLALQVRSAFFGNEALRVQRGREDVRVYTRLPASERDSLADLNTYRIRTPGGFVPLHQVAEVGKGLSPTSIRRRNGRRIVAVTANIDNRQITSNEVNAYIADTIMPPLQARYPGLTYDFGGEQREQARTAPAMAMNFMYALIVIYAMLAIAFKSYTQPLIVMTVIPFGVFGAIMGHLIMGMNLSLLSLFGIIGLSGVIINGALVMIDFINEERRNGKAPIEAIIAGAKSRFRPIFLTSLTTFLGVGPLIFESSVQAQFLIPVALSLGFGVLFGTVLLLLMVPALMSLYGAQAGAGREINYSGQMAAEYQSV